MEDPSPFGDLAGELYRRRSEPPPPPSPKTTVLSFRVPQSQIALLRHLGDYLGMNRSQLASSLLTAALESFVLDLLEKPKGAEEREELIQQLREGGVEVDEFDDTVTFRRDVS